MCSGNKRKEMLRQAYRLGYESGRVDLLAEQAGSNTPLPDNVVSLDEMRDAQTRRHANA